MADIVPKEILTRQKWGFELPAGFWVFGSLHDEVYQRITEGQLIKKILDQHKLQKLLQNFNIKGQDTQFERTQHPRSYRRGYLLWMLYALEMWHDIHLN